jgi:hypothetical protein
MSCTPAQCGNALEQWIGQEGATYTGYLEFCEDAQSPAQSVHVTVDIDGHGVTLTGWGGSPQRPHKYRFRPDRVTITWGIEGPHRELSNPVCDGNGTVTKAEMLLTEADDTRLKGQVSRVGAGFAAE